MKRSAIARSSTQPHLPQALATHYGRAILAALGLLGGVLAFLLSGDNTYRPAGVATWLIGVAGWGLACATRPSMQQQRLPMLPALLFIGALGLGAFFRFHQLADLPRDMNSDHAEKLLDVLDVLAGRTPIFFERNTGREPFQFYWTAALIRLLGLQPDFLALKLGTALIGLLGLPAVFLLGRELWDWRAGALAMAFAGVASWGVLVQRFGLRAGLNATMVAWALWLTTRALRSRSRNAMLSAGVAIGVGLQGYSPFRFFPLVFAVLLLAQALSLRRPMSKAARELLIGAGMSGVMAVLVAVPLLRYAVDQPAMFLYRAATRLGEVEQPLPGPPLAILASNLARAALMFHVIGDETWVSNLQYRPVLDPLLGALLPMGMVMAVVRGLRRRDTLLAALPLTVLVLLLPSALSLAFPRENPSAGRAVGALPAVMVLCALPVAALLARLSKRLGPLAGALAVSVVAAVTGLNYQRVFVDYAEQYCRRAQNASDIAHTIQRWVAAGHDPADAWLVSYPHWVDSRAVGVWLGDIHFKNVVGASVNLPDVSTVRLRSGKGLFILHPADQASLGTLTALYPNGRSAVMEGTLCDGREFIAFSVE